MHPVFLQALCGNCPLGLKLRDAPGVECHLEPVHAVTQKPVTGGVFAPNQVPMVQLVYEGGWRIFGVDSPGCSHHPAIAAFLAKVQASVRIVENNGPNVDPSEHAPANAEGISNGQETEGAKIPEVTDETDAQGRQRLLSRH